ncbi:MAG TPA: ATP-dependent helicase C-terminal domain-containing protein, partial [Longimicrobiales bacterium]|nr:ATP-dependent helicase C-terminal domain-containing protein [Longimicrobiales bacterium]
PQPLAGEEWIVAAEVQGRGAEARIFRAAALAAEDVERHFGGQARTEEVVEWDARAGRARAFRRRTLGALVLEEAQVPVPPDAAPRALLAAVREGGLRLLPWSRETGQLRHRLRFLHRLEPEAWPDTSDEALLETLDAWLLPFLPGARSLRDLAGVDLAEALLSRVPWGTRARIEELAPARLEVPTGSRIAIDYSDPDAPALAVKLQEVFGLAETPRIGGGRVPLTMELLSPARRPVQVTRDLASFWRDAYFEVRKELRGRYPKHPWPEDPLMAEPTRRTKRRGGG